MNAVGDALKASVLVVEDEATLARNVSTFLGRRQFEVRIADSGEASLSMLGDFDPDIVLLDHCLPGISGFEVLKRIRQTDRHVKVVMITGQGGVRLAVDAMKAGADDYLAKPVVLSELEVLCDKLVGYRRLEQEVEYHRHRVSADGGVDALLGVSAQIRAVRRRIVQFLGSERRLRGLDPPTVLISGETGTGKEIVARAFHVDGPRANRPFIELNCAAIPGDLIEAELFGYERGAFTDAKARKYGLVESADGGTLFLDEIGDMNTALQSKLLTLLEQKRVRRVGGLQDRTVDVRIIAATNQDLDLRVRDNAFRQDLLYRLRVIHLELPPLRQRDGDVLYLARHFLAVQGERYARRRLRLDEAAESLLVSYHWPGNVRELRNVVEQAVLLADGIVVGAEHILLPSGRDSPPAQPSDAPMSLEQTEVRLMQKALKECGGNVTRAARMLGISRDKLRYRLGKLDIGPGRGE